MSSQQDLLRVINDLQRRVGELERREDTAATATAIGNVIHGATEKLTIADDDEFGGIDTEASNVLTWWKWSTIKTTIATWLATMLTTAIVRAASAAGLRMEDDAGTAGLIVVDGGDASAPLGITVGASTPAHQHNRIQIGATDPNGASVMEFSNDAETKMFWFLQPSASGSHGEIRTDSARDIILQSSATTTGNVSVGATATRGKLDVDQASATAAIPVLVLDQADVSEEFIEFVGTVGTGNSIEAKGAKTLTVTHFIRINIAGVGYRYLQVGTIA